MSLIEIAAPLDGWLVPLAEVPDPVFSAGLAGDGVAIDPVSDTLLAPCEGTVRLMRAGRHALTLDSAAGDVLLHVGIDTVSLRGEGFTLLVADGAQVGRGVPLLRFDLDLLARRAPSVITPVVLAGAKSGELSSRRVAGRVRVGDVLFAAVAKRPGVADGVEVGERVAVSRRFTVPFDHGLHARPAASVAAALDRLAAEVEIHAHGRQTNARSMIGLMGLGVARGDEVEVIARGPAASAALAALATLFGPPARRPAAATVDREAPPAAGTVIRGVVAARGIAIGSAYRWTAPELGQVSASGDAALEQRRLDDALQAVLAHLRARSALLEGPRRDVVEAHFALVADPGLRGDAARCIDAGEGAAAAWSTTIAAAAEALARLNDARMAERRADLRDLEQQVLRVLAGQTPDAAVALPERAIVLADDLLPSQLLSVDPAHLAGIACAGGGATSHAAILAGSLGIPMLVAAGASVLAIADGVPVVLDAEAGELHVAPSPEVLGRHERRIAARATEAAEDARRAMEPARMQDGTVVRVDGNLGALAEAAVAVAAGADGCGLLRTEFLFLERDTAPTESEQCEVYTAIASALGGRPLTIRTLDAGGDKPIPFLPMPTEENPALGLRGVRTGFWRPELLESQLRAILRASATGPCRLLLPMVTDVADVLAVRECLARIGHGAAGPSVQVGIMIETPASAMLADQLAPLVDFFSIGTNDLAQYVLAIDRLHPSLAARLDGLHPAVLRTIATAARAAMAHGREVCVCGGLASDPDAVPLLLGLGVRELSVLPAMVARIKNIVRRLDPTRCESLARRALDLGSPSDVRRMVRDADAGGAAGTGE